MRESYTTISLTLETVKDIDEIKKQGKYQSRAEVVRNLVRKELTRQ